MGSNRMPQSGREYWVKLFLPKEAPSDAVRVRLKETDTCVFDLKMRLLEEVASSMLFTPSIHWTTLAMPPSPADNPDEQKVVELDSSDELSELPEGAGSKWWHLHADVRLREHLGTSSSYKKGDTGRGKTLQERGIAGPHEPEHIKNAMDMKDLYPGSSLPAGARDEFSLFLVIKIIACVAILCIVGVPLVYILERLPRSSATPQEFAAEIL